MSKIKQALESEVGKAIAALTGLSYMGECLVCGHPGHAPDCALAATRAALESFLRDDPPPAQELQPGTTIRSRKAALAAKNKAVRWAIARDLKQRLGYCFMTNTYSLGIGDRASIMANHGIGRTLLARVLEEMGMRAVKRGNTWGKPMVYRKKETQS